jgi:chromosome partitioning protein
VFHVKHDVACGEAQGGAQIGTILAVVNQKGGVGKTTTAVNLGAALAGLGHRVLLVDMDAQGNATTAFGIDRQGLERCVYDALLSQLDPAGQGPDLVDVTEETCVEGLDLVPARMELAAAELELAAAMAREMVLRRLMVGTRERYDYILLDSAPSLGLLTVNCLTAADGILIPIQCEYYALEGLSQLLRVVRMVETSLNPGLALQGVVLTMYDGRTRLSRDVANEVRRHLGGKTYRTAIPRNIRVGEAPSHGLPVVTYDPDSAGARAYRLLAKEVIEREEARARQRT